MSIWRNRLLTRSLRTYRTPTRARPQLLRLEDRVTPTVNLTVAFTGLQFGDPGNDATPPDTNAAAGPDRVIETVNNSAAIYTKGGSLIATDTLANIFNESLSIVSDPIVIYDEYAQRFVMYVLGIDNPNGGSVAHLNFAVSNNSAPTNFSTDWSEKHTFDETATIGGATSWGDYPRFGYNADAWVITENQFDFNNQNAFLGVQVFVMDKLPFLDNNPATGTVIKSFPDPAFFTLNPAQMHGAQPGAPMWFVDGDNNGASEIHVVEMTNVLSANPTFTDNAVPVTPYSRASTSPQPGAAGDVSGGDSRITSVDWRNNRLVATHNVDNNGINNVSWYEFNTGGIVPTLTQDALINPGNGIGTLFGGITINPQGAIGVTYMESSATEFLSMLVTGQNPGDPVGTLQTPVVAFGGQATYDDGFGGPFRLGDFSTVVMDPTDGSFWAANEYANNGNLGINWGTGMAHFDTGLIGGGGGGGGGSPGFGTLYFVPDPVKQGTQSTLFAAFTDPGPGQFVAHAVEIDWTDGTPHTKFTLGPGIQSFHGLHTYYDVGTYVADVTINTTSGNTLTNSAGEQVVNVAPTIAITGFPTAPVPEGKPVTISATVTDPGIHDTFSYFWSVNKNNVLFTVGTGAAFTFTPDDNATYRVFVAVVDQSGGAGTAPPKVFTAFNVAPTATLTSDSPKPSGSPVTVTFSNIVDAAADVAAGFKYSFDWNNDGVFEIPNQPSPSATHNFTPDGRYKVHGRITDKDGGFSDVYGIVSEGIGGNAGIITTRYLATGTDIGGGPHVRVFNTDGTVKREFMAYSVGFLGGVRVAVGDVNGDGVEDVITAAGPGGGPHVKVFSGTDNSLLYSFLAGAPTFTGGLMVATGDVNGDGFSDIVVGFGPGGGGRVRVFSGQTGALIDDFIAYANFPGAVSVAAADVNGDFKADVITGPGAGGGPHVKVVDATKFGLVDGAGNILSSALIGQFMAFPTTFNGGIYVSAGDVDGDGLADVIVGMGASATLESRVRVFSANGFGVLRDFAAFAGYQGGVRVAADDLDGDGKADLIVARGANKPSSVLALKGTNLTQLLNFAPYDPSFLGGVFVG